MPKFCRVDFSTEWGNGVSLARTGKAQPACASGVMVLAQNPPQLESGTRWRRGRYLCLGEATSVTCTTKTGAHGFRVDDAEMRVW